MKKITILAALFVAIPSLIAQKKEIKKAQQEVNAGNLQSAQSYLDQAKRIFAAADSETRAQYYVVEAEMKLASKTMDMEKLESISNSLKRAISYDPGSSLLTRIAKVKSSLKNLSAEAALGEFTKKNYANAATLYDVAYQSTRDTTHYFNAAKSHLLAKEYDKAFQKYSNLVRMGYTNAQLRYVATNAKSNKKEAFSSINKRNLAISQGSHKNPEVVRAGSKIPQLLRGVTTSAMQLNQTHSAVAVIDELVRKYPKDISLLNQVFHLYHQLGAKDKYDQVVALLIKEAPNDPNLYYNFGISSTQSNEVEEAINYYKKTLALDPNHINAKTNLSILLLDQETAILEEMNNLGMTPEDDKRYEELKGKRNDLYLEVLPYLESIVKSQPNNKSVAKQLMDIYGHIGQQNKLSSLQERFDD